MTLDCWNPFKFMIPDWILHGYYCSTHTVTWHKHVLFVVAEKTMKTEKSGTEGMTISWFPVCAWDLDSECRFLLQDSLQAERRHKTAIDFQ